MRQSKSHSYDSVDFSVENEKYHRRHTSGSDGVRFSDMSSDQRSKNERSYFSGDYNYRTSKEKYRGGEKSHRRSERSSHRKDRRSQSFDDNEEFDTQGQNRRHRQAERESGHSINYEVEENKRGNLRQASSRSKSHDSGERKTSRRKQYLEEEDEARISGSSGESYQAPFYLHSSHSQTSSHYGYERIQSLFHESSEQLDANENSKQKLSRREKTRNNRDSSPRKRQGSSRGVEFDVDTNNNHSSDQQRSPKRRAAPAMPLPESSGVFLLSVFVWI